jgi:hypothetical protein
MKRETAPQVKLNGNLKKIENIGSNGALANAPYNSIQA